MFKFFNFLKRKKTKTFEEISQKVIDSLKYSNPSGIDVAIDLTSRKQKEEQEKERLEWVSNHSE